MRRKLKMSEKVHHEGASDRTGIFVQVEETMTNEFYVGFSCCQHPKNCSFCNCASLWPMWYIHRLRVNIYTHPRKNKMVKKKKKKLAQTWGEVIPCLHNDNIVLFSLPPGVFICAQHGKCWSLSPRDIETFLTGRRCPKSFLWIKINTLKYKPELSAHSLPFVVNWKAKQISC